MNTQNSELRVSEKGTYELIEVQDRRCLGSVIPQEGTWNVDWVPKPSVLFSASAGVLMTKNNSIVRPAVCEGVDDFAEVRLTGATMMYHQLVKEYASNATSVALMIQAVHRITFRIPSSRETVGKNSRRSTASRQLPGCNYAPQRLVTLPTDSLALGMPPILLNMTWPQKKANTWNRTFWGVPLRTSRHQIVSHTAWEMLSRPDLPTVKRVLSY